MYPALESLHRLWWRTAQATLAAVAPRLQSTLGQRCAQLIAAHSALVLEAETGKILYAQDADRPCPPASVTKLMTLRLAYQAIRAGRIRPEERVRITAQSSVDHPLFHDASVMFLKAGESPTVEELMQGLAIPSACDAAVAMAEQLAGSTDAFVVEMNREAERLGMARTRFVDPHRLSPENQSTARDLARLALRYVQEEPAALVGLHSQSEFTYRSHRLSATNLLIGRYPGADGLKTGFLESAGYHQISTAIRGNRRLIGVVMGTASKRARRDESARLLDLGFGLVGIRGSTAG